MREDVENKIVMWLKEERLSPNGLEDPECFFNYSVKVGDMFLNVMQESFFSDSITVCCSMLYSDNQLLLLNERMDAGSKREYLNKLDTKLTLHPYIFNFYMEEKRVLMQSKRLYYGHFTKDDLMHMVYLMAKMFKLPMRLLDDYFQMFWPGWKAKNDPELENMR